MLIDFSVKNFTSISDKMVLSAETGERLSRLRNSNTIIENNQSLLKNLVIVGPNGSGKSNLIAAIKLMRQIVFTNPPRVTDPLPFKPFRLADGKENEPTTFSIHFNYAEVELVYTFSYLQNQIVFEELKQILKTTERIYFSRDYQNYSVIPDELKSIADHTKQNSLLLYGAQNANDQMAIAVMQWFQNDLIFVDDLRIPDQLANLMKRDQIKTEFLRFLQFADFNITDVKVQEVPTPPVPEDLKKMLATLSGEIEVPATMQELYTTHKKYDAQGNVVGTQNLPLSAESRGTQKIFLIALSIINAQLGGNGKSLLFDEFDDSLHFELSKALLKIFNSPQNKNQFILTTHELQLLDSDLRTDQIYLMEKDFQGRSDLKSVFDFKDSRDTARHDVKFMKRYIEGRFGAMPQINVQEMLSSLTIEDN